jgi:hypothetical protein
MPVCHYNASERNKKSSTCLTITYNKTTELTKLKPIKSAWLVFQNEMRISILEASWKNISGKK